MGNVTNTLATSIQVTDDASQTQILNRVVTGLTFDSTIADGLFILPLINGNNNIPLPLAKCYQLYVRNKSQTNSIVVEITTPTTGGVQTVATLYPGDVFILWQNPTSKNPNAGFTALDLVGIGPNVLAEYFIGG